MKRQRLHDLHCVAAGMSVYEDEHYADVKAAREAKAKRRAIVRARIKVSRKLSKKFRKTKQ